jgi:hypothetical protein
LNLQHATANWLILVLVFFGIIFGVDPLHVFLLIGCLIFVLLRGLFLLMFVMFHLKMGLIGSPSGEKLHALFTVQEISGLLLLFCFLINLITH